MVVYHRNEHTGLWAMSVDGALPVRVEPEEVPEDVHRAEKVYQRERREQIAKERDERIRRAEEMRRLQQDYEEKEARVAERNRKLGLKARA